MFPKGQPKDENDRFRPALNRDINWSALPVSVAEPEVPDHPNVQRVAALVEDVADVIKQIQEAQVDVIPEWAKPDLDVRFHLVIDGKLDADPVGPVITGLNLGLIRCVMKQLSRLTLNQIHHYAILGAHLNNMFKIKQLVDVIVRVEDHSFSATRLCLSCHSNLFADIFMNSLVPPYAITEVTLKDIDKETFKTFLHFVHFGEVSIDELNVESLLKISDILQSSTLRAKILLFANIRTEVNWQEAIMLLRSKSPLTRLVAIHAITKSFMELLDAPHFFKVIRLEDMINIIGSNDLNVLTELDVFWAVLYWTIVDKETRLEHLDTLIQHVRFSCMSSLELLDCARANNMMSISTTCRQLLVKAHWISHANELGLEDPLLFAPDTPRSHLIDEAPYVPTVKDFDTRFVAFKQLSRSMFGGNTPSDPEKESEQKEKKGKQKKGKKDRQSADTPTKESKGKGKGKDKKSRGKGKGVKDKTSTDDEDDKSQDGDGAEEAEERHEAEKTTQDVSPKHKARINSTHEFKGGHWKRKRHRGGGRFDLSQALAGLDLDDEDGWDGKKSKGEAGKEGAAAVAKEGGEVKQGEGGTAGAVAEAASSDASSSMGSDAPSSTSSAKTGPVMGMVVAAALKKRDMVSTVQRNEPDSLSSTPDSARSADSTPSSSAEETSTTTPTTSMTSQEAPPSQESSSEPSSSSSTPEPSSSPEPSSLLSSSSTSSSSTSPSPQSSESTLSSTISSSLPSSTSPSPPPPTAAAAPPPTTKPGDAPNTSQNYRRIPGTSSSSLVVTQDRTPNLLDEPDIEMVQHLYPVLRPIPTRVVPKRLRRSKSESSDDDDQSDE